MRREVWRSAAWLGWLFCETAFRTGCRFPLGWTYRVGCWFYGWEGEYGKRHGFLVPNPRYGEDEEPMYIEAI